MGTIGQRAKGSRLAWAAMAAVLAGLTILTAWSGEGLVTRVRPLARHIGYASAVLLWLAGAYAVYRWLLAIRLL